MLCGAEFSVSIGFCTVLIVSNSHPVNEGSERIRMTSKSGAKAYQSRNQLLKGQQGAAIINPNLRSFSSELICSDEALDNE